MGCLLYGAGLRVLECCRLRVQDVDFAANQIVVRGGKGDKNRVTMLPAVVKTDLEGGLWMYTRLDMLQGLAAYLGSTAAGRSSATCRAERAYRGGEGLIRIRDMLQGPAGYRYYAGQPIPWPNSSSAKSRGGVVLVLARLPGQ